MCRSSSSEGAQVGLKGKSSALQLCGLLVDEYAGPPRDALHDNVCSATVVPAPAAPLACGDAEVRFVNGKAGQNSRILRVGKPATRRI